jgi:hypothetical protein
LIKEALRKLWTIKDTMTKVIPKDKPPDGAGLNNEDDTTPSSKYSSKM